MLAIPAPPSWATGLHKESLRDWLEIDEAAAEIVLCDGAGDGGIDAAVLVKADPAEGVEGSTWILVQSKYGTALSGPNTITIEAQKLFATLEGKRASLSSLSAELVDRLRTFLSNVGDKDKLEYVVATSRKLADLEREYRTTFACWAGVNSAIALIRS